jgi:hypothetical protein
VCSGMKYREKLCQRRHSATWKWSGEQNAARPSRASYIWLVTSHTLAVPQNDWMDTASQGRSSTDERQSIMNTLMLVSPRAHRTKLRSMPFVLFHLFTTWYRTFPSNATKPIINSFQAFDETREPKKKSMNWQKRKKR